MGALAVRRLPVVDEPPRPRQPRLFAVPGGAVVLDAPPTPAPAAPATTEARALLAAVPSLDHLLTGVWRTLESGCAAACPSCGESMAPRWTAGAGAAGGRCSGCGALFG